MADNDTAEIKARLRVEADKGAAKKAGKDIADALKEGADSASKGGGGSAASGIGKLVAQASLASLAGAGGTPTGFIPSPPPGGVRQQPVQGSPGGGVSLSKNPPAYGITNEGASAARAAARSSYGRTPPGGYSADELSSILQNTNFGVPGARAGRRVNISPAQRAALDAIRAQGGNNAGSGTPLGGGSGAPTGAGSGAGSGPLPPVGGPPPGGGGPSGAPLGGGSNGSGSGGGTPLPPLGSGAPGGGARGRRQGLGPWQRQEYNKWVGEQVRAMRRAGNPRATRADVQRAEQRGDIQFPGYAGGASGQGPRSTAEANRQADIQAALASGRPVADEQADRVANEQAMRRANNRARANRDAQRNYRDRIYGDRDARLIERQTLPGGTGRGRLDEAQLQEYAQQYGIPPTTGNLDILRNETTARGRQRAAELLGGTAPGGTPGAGVPPVPPPVGPTPLDTQTATRSQLRQQFIREEAQRSGRSVSQVQRDIELGRTRLPANIAGDETRSQRLSRVQRARANRENRPLADVQDEDLQTRRNASRQERIQQTQLSQQRAVESQLHEENLSGQAGGYGRRINAAQAEELLGHYGLPPTRANIAAIQAGGSPGARGRIARNIPGFTEPGSPGAPGAPLGGASQAGGTGFGTRLAAGISGIGSLALLVNAGMMYHTMTQGAIRTGQEATTDYNTHTARLIQDAVKVRNDSEKQLLENTKAVAEEEHNYQLGVKDFNKQRVQAEKSYFLDVQDRQQQRADTVQQYQRSTQDIGRSRQSLELGFSRAGADYTRDRGKIETDYGRDVASLNRDRANAERDFTRQYQDLARQRQATELDYGRTVQDIARDRMSLEKDYFRQVQDNQKARIQLELDFNRQATDLAKQRDNIERQNARTQRDLAKERTREQEDYNKNVTRLAEDQRDQDRQRAADQEEHLKKIQEQQKASAAAQFAALGGLVNAAQGGDPFAIVSALFRLEELNRQKQQVSEDASRGGYTKSEAIDKEIQDRQAKEARTDVETAHTRAGEDQANAQKDADENHKQALADLDVAIQRNNENYAIGLDNLDTTIKRNNQDYQTGLDNIAIQIQRNNENYATALQNIDIAEQRLNENRASALQSFAIAEGQLAADRLLALADLDLAFSRTVEDFKTGIQDLALAQFRANEDYAKNIALIDQAQHLAQQNYIENVKTISEAETEADRTHLLNLDTLEKRQDHILEAEADAMQQIAEQRMDLDRQLQKQFQAVNQEIDTAFNQLVFALALNAVFAGQMVTAFKTMAASASVAATLSGAGGAGGAAGAAGVGGLGAAIAGGVGAAGISVAAFVGASVLGGAAIGLYAEQARHALANGATLGQALTGQGPQSPWLQAYNAGVPASAIIGAMEEYATTGKVTPLNAPANQDSGATPGVNADDTVAQANAAVERIKQAAPMPSTAAPSPPGGGIPNGQNPVVNEGKDVYQYNPQTGTLEKVGSGYQYGGGVNPADVTNPRPWEVDKHAGGSSSVADWARVLFGEDSTAKITTAQIDTKLKEANEAAALIPPEFQDSTEYAKLIADRFNEAAEKAKQIQEQFGAITVTVNVTGGGNLTFGANGQVVGGSGTNYVDPGTTAPGGGTPGGDSSVGGASGDGTIIELGTTEPRKPPKRRLNTDTGQGPAYIDEHGNITDNPLNWDPGVAPASSDHYFYNGASASGRGEYTPGGPWGMQSGSGSLPDQHASVPVNSVGVRQVGPSGTTKTYTQSDVDAWYKAHPQYQGQYDQWKKDHPNGPGSGTAGAGGSGIHVYNPGAPRTSPPPNPPPPPARPGTIGATFPGNGVASLPQSGSGNINDANGWGVGVPGQDTPIMAGTDPVSALVPRLDSLITLLSSGQPIVIPGGTVREQLHRYFTGDKVV